MRLFIVTCCLALLGADVEAGQTDSEMKSLYDARKWVELSDRLKDAKGKLFYRGAIGVTFNQEPRRTEKMLLSVIRSAPRSAEAYDAYEWLSHSYLYRGQYRSLFSIMQKRWAAFPNKKEREQEQRFITGFRGLPNQILEKAAPSTLHHENGSIFVPLSINGNSATYFFDTGALVSCVSESEARRLGLKVTATDGTIGNASGTSVGFRVAVAKEVVIGNVRFKNVSFAVLPDQEPFADVPTSRRGIIGVPLLVGLSTLRWTKKGFLEVGYRPEAFDIRKSNLRFDNDHIAVGTTVEQRSVFLTVDTGAETTDLYKPFAHAFASLLKDKGKKSSTEVRGIGHVETFDSVTLPELRMQLGGFDTVLSSAPPTFFLNLSAQAVALGTRVWTCLRRRRPSASILGR